MNISWLSFVDLYTQIIENDNSFDMILKCN